MKTLADIDPAQPADKIALVIALHGEPNDLAGGISFYRPNGKLLDDAVLARALRLYLHELETVELRWEDIAAAAAADDTVIGRGEQ